MFKRVNLHHFFRLIIALSIFALSLSALSGTVQAGGPQDPERASVSRTPISLSEVNSYYGPKGLMKGPIGIIVEFADDPGALIYAAAPSAATAQVRMIQRTQDAFIADVESRGIGYTELFRTQRAYNGIWMTVDTSALDTIAQMNGVKAIHPMIPKELDHTTSVPLIGAPAVWAGVGAFQGQDINVGIIDTGIDYHHAMFGGDEFSTFPTAKVVGGYDFAGDAYDASSAPVPDNDPDDCNGHGSHVAGTTAGYGVLADHTTFVEGVGDTYADLVGLSASAYQAKFYIGPGVAPKANLYALRVFGCEGSTNLTTQAIEWAMDPNGDDDMSDHLDAINMSLGSAYGTEYDDSAVASNNAAMAGVIVVASAGNSGDVFYVTGAPGAARYALSVASSQDSSSWGSSFAVTAAPTYPLGNYPAGLASFGPQEFYVNANLATTTPLNGCTAITEDLTGKIALIDRGSCTFKTKALMAQNNGAVGVLIVNNVAGFPPGMANDAAITTAITIPTMSTSKTVGDALRADIGGGTVTVTLDSASPLAFALEPSYDDVISSFSSRGPARGTYLKPDITAPGDTIWSAAVDTGTEGANFSGTSMAAPHVTGVMALLKQAHPAWSVADLKALAMNTATNNIYSTNGKTVLNSPTRVGAGRVNIPNALNSPSIAYLAADPGSVSVSFGTVTVTGSTQNFQKMVEVKNTSGSAITYNLAMIERYRTTTGLTWSFRDAGNTATITSILVPANGTAQFLVRATVNPAMSKRYDLSLSMGLTTGSNRDWMAEGGGFIELTSGGVQTLRVPVHIAARPASAMSLQETQITFPDSATGTFSLTPMGYGFAPYGDFYYNHYGSYGAIMELMGESINEPTSLLTNDAADLKYVGASFWDDGDCCVPNQYDAVYFGLATYGKWNTPNAYGGPEFDIYIDVDEDGEYDYILWNADSGAYTSSRTDDLITWLVDLHANTATPQTYLNDWTGNLDTNKFNNNVMVMPVYIADLGLDLVTNPDFNFVVYSFNREAAGVVDSISTPMHYDISEQAFSVVGGGDYGPFVEDNPIYGPYTIAYDKNVIADRGSLGLLMLHLHNASNNAEVLKLTPLSVETFPAFDQVITAPSAQFGVLFNQPATGVDAADFALTSGALLNGATITDVSGAGQNYVVTVSGYTGTGSLTLDVAEDASIMAASGLGLPGAYTSGTPIYIATTMAFRSIGAHDGWILESGENTSYGGSYNISADTFRLGDFTGDKQYRSFLSFNTGALLPDNAVVISATLQMKQKGGLTGNNSPFTWGGGLGVDVCRGMFGVGSGLPNSDFNFMNTSRCTAAVGKFGATPADAWYTARLKSPAFERISTLGVTQFRLAFKEGDNNDSMSDFLSFFSGNNVMPYRPLLIIGYYVP